MTGFDFIDQRDVLVRDGILRRQNLPGTDLYIYNYKNWCKTWNDITLNSRGIIFNHKTGETVAYPFPKFFNMNQRQETREDNLPWEEGFRIFKKEDGWLGILYRHAGQHKIATRGSFNNPTASWATKHIQQYNLIDLPDDVTLLFEIICPLTHIVVDYNNMENIILLTAYNRYTGKEYNWDYIVRLSQKFGFTLVQSYDQNQLKYCREQLKTISGKELEGFVVRFNNGLRIKIKSHDYFRRSYVLANLTPLNIWKEMISGKASNFKPDFIDDIDHYNKMALFLETKYNQIFNEIQSQFNQIANKSNRKIFAQKIKNMNHKPALFALFDNKYDCVDKYILQQIKPKNNIIQ